MTTFYQQHQQQYTTYNLSNFPSYHHYLLYTKNGQQQPQKQPQKQPSTEKLNRRLSFASLLQKRPSLSRTLSIFSRNNNNKKKKKSQLSIVTPLQIPFDNSDLDRMDSMTTATSSSSSDSTLTDDDDDEYGPITPSLSITMPTPPTPSAPAPPIHDPTLSLDRYAPYYNNNNSSCLSVNLETALTVPMDKPPQPIDYTGQKYSNFYIKLPNGNWMVRVRDANRKIVGTYEVNGSMI